MKISKFVSRLLSTSVLLLLLTGCAPAESSQPEDSSKIRAVATIFPQYDFLRQIGGDHLELTMLLKPGSESHSFEPTPADMIAVSRSDLFVYVGGDSDAWVETILESVDTSGKEIVTLMDCVETVAEEEVEGMESHGHAHDLSHVHLGRDNGEMCAGGHHTLHTAGLVLAAAVALHNMPVGMAIGATFAGDAASAGHGGVLAALIIGLHNLPEGMSIAAPLLSGGSRPAGAIAVAAASGIPTILGALLGYSVGAMSPGLLSVSLSFAAGAMLYVVFGELLPESEDLWRHKLSGLSTLLGLLLGLALIAGGGHVH